MGFAQASYMDAKDWGTGYYPDNLQHTNLVKRLLMYGVKDSAKGYVPHGSVYGVYNKTWDSLNHKWIPDIGDVQIGLDKVNRKPQHLTLQ